MLRRLLQLYIGLTLYGVSTAMFVRADLGADPWNVFHLGVAKLLSLNIGVVMIAVGALVLLLWIPLRQRPGLGTISNVVMIGLAADAALVLMPPLESLLARIGNWNVYRCRIRCRPARWPDDRYQRPHRLVGARGTYRH